MRASTTFSAREEIAGFISGASVVSADPGANSGLLLALSVVLQLSTVAKSWKGDVGKLWTTVAMRKLL
jgi:hypothetical protein